MLSRSRKNTITFALMLAMALTSSCHQQPEQVVIYISPNGSDAFSGLLAKPDAEKTDGPLATLAVARSAIRQLKQERGLPPGGITVRLAGGTYSFAETLTLEEADSGTDSAVVIWQAAPGEQVVFSGGRELHGFEPVTDQAILQRLDAVASEHILQINLQSLGIENYGELGETKGPGLELFCDGERMQLARYPNTGYLKITEVPQSGAELIHQGSWQWRRFGIPVGRHFGRIKYDDDRPGRWQPARDIWLHGYFCWDWRDGFQQVAEIDAQNRELILAPPYHNYGFHQEQRFYFLNVLEELDQPGEWYLDRGRGVLYFWPPAPLATASIKVSLLPGPLLSLNNASHLRFEHITFELGRSNAITISGGSHNAIAGCTVCNFGTTAIIVEGGDDQGILSCEIYNLGGGGVELNSGDRKTLSSGNSFVENTHIHDFGQVRKTTCPAINTSGVANRISHNLIHDSPDAGVMYWGNEMLLEFNEIHHIAKESDDVGAFYFGRDYTMRGNVIRHNYFHRLQKPMHVGVMSVYLDDFASGATIYGNIFYKAGRAAFMGGGRSNTVENNIFIECSPSIFLDARGLVRNTEYFDGRLTTLIDRMQAMNYTEPPYSEKYPELLKLYDDDPARPKYNRIVRNISVGGRWLDLYSGLELSVLEMKGNLIADPVIFRTSAETGVETENFTEFEREDEEIAAEFEQLGNRIIKGDPGFVDFDNEDFRLRNDSPAFQLGFQKIPMEKIGLYVDEYRQALPSKRTNSGSR